MSTKVLRLKGPSVARQAREVARLKVIQGPDVNVIFVLTHREVSMGRGDENDLVLTDLKASRTHAVLKQTESGWTIEDAGSSNGLLVNQKPTRASALSSGDVVVLGGTTLQFFGENSATQVLSAPPKALTQVKKEVEALGKQKAWVKELGQLGTPQAVKDALKSLQNGVKGAAPSGKQVNPVILIAAVATFALFILFPDGDLDGTTAAKKKASRGPASESEKISSDLPSYRSPSAAAENFFHQGFREYREKNYARARVQFRNTLMVDPNHPLARFYLQNTEKRLSDLIEQEFTQGRKQAAIGKLRKAQSHFESVVRLLAQDPAHPKAIESQMEIKDLEQRILGLPALPRRVPSGGSP